MLNPSEIVSKIQNIRSENGRIKKSLILKEYLNDEGFCEFIKHVFNFKKNYYIEEMPEFEQSDFKSTLPTIISYLNVLAMKNSCTDEEKNTLIKFAASDKDLYEVTKMLISKSLNCGVGVKTVNSVKPNLITIQPYMRCSQIDQMPKISCPCFVQEKMNSEFITVEKHNNSICYKTRSGNILHLNGIFDNYFNNLKVFQISECVFLGEILVVGIDGKYLMREAANGIINKALRGTLSEYEIGSIHLVLWDIVNYNHYYNIDSVDKVKYLYRFNFLKELLVQNPANNIKLVPYIIAKNHSEVFEFLDNILSQEKEGIIVKDFDNLFENGTSPSQVKIVPIREADLRIVKWNYGEKNKKYAGCLGSISLESEDELVQVDCGIGFSDKLRGYLGYDNLNKPINGIDPDIKKFWDNQIGKIVSVTYKEIVKHAILPNKFSLISAVYKIDRPDKILADTYKRLNESKYSYLIQKLKGKKNAEELLKYFEILKQG